MKVGFIGAGNMAAALARGWGEPVLCTDSGSGRAQALAEELGGEAAGSNYELAVNADVVVLAHKPAQLAAVAREAAPAARAVVSLLARITIEELRAAYPDTPVVRVQPNTPAEVGRGVTLLAEPAEEPLGGEVEELFERVGIVVRLPESLLDAAAACSGVGPALLGARRRGVGRRRDPPRHPRAGGPAARDRDDGRQRRAAARPRPRHASGCAARSPRPAGRPRAASPRSSAAASAPPSRPPWTTCWGRPDAREHRRLRRRPDPRLHDLHRRLGGALARLLARRAGALQPLRRAGSWTSCATSPTRSCNLFRRLPLQIGPLDLTPMVAIIVLQIGGGIIVGLIDPNR